MTTLHYLREGYALIEKLGAVPPPYAQIKKVRSAAVLPGKNSALFLAICESFYLFRFYHNEVESRPKEYTLLGDMFYGMYYRYMARFNDLRLNEAFSHYLAEDAGNTEMTGDDYMDFIADLARNIGGNAA